MRPPQTSLAVLLTSAVLACQSATGPAVTLRVTKRPDVAGVVASKTHDQSLLAYDLSVAGDSLGILNSLGIARGNLLVPDTLPVFVRNRFGLALTTADRIRLRDSVEIWRSASWATQVVIVQ